MYTHVAVIIRHLPGSEPTVSAVYGIPVKMAITNQAYADQKKEEHVKSFTQQFVEFRHAAWSVEIHELVPTWLPT